MMIELFIKEFKRAVLNQNIYFIGGRQKNKDFLSKLGWTAEDVINFLFSELSPSHYIEGPEEERDPAFGRGIVYKFMMKIEGYDVYVKIKKQEENFFFLILSFHESER